MVLSEAMSGLLGSGISAFSSLGSGLINSALSGRAAKKAYKYNKKLMEQQQAWNEKMFNKQVDLSNTAHTREVADLRNAGLNPILSATGGNGSSTPASFGSASASGVSVNTPQVDLNDAISSALQIRQQKNSNKLTESQSKLTDQQYKTEIWKALNEQQQYDDYTPALIRQIDTNISNSIIKTAAEVRNLDANAQAQLITAHSTADWNRRRATGKSQSYSWSEDTSDNKNLGIHLHGVSSGSGYSRKSSHSHSWTD